MSNFPVHQLRVLDLSMHDAVQIDPSILEKYRVTGRGMGYVYHSLDTCRAKVALCSICECTISLIYRTGMGIASKQPGQPPLVYPYVPDDSEAIGIFGRRFPLTCEDVKRRKIVGEVMDT